MKHNASLPQFLLFFERKITKSSLWIFPLFCLRAILCCVGLVILRVYTHQMIFLIAIQLLYLSAILHLKDQIWQSNMLIILQCIDEVLILLTLIAHFAFSAFVPDIATRDTFGVIIIGIILTVVAIHAVTLSYQICLSIRLVYLRITSSFKQKTPVPLKAKKSLSTQGTNLEDRENNASQKDSHP